MSMKISQCMAVEFLGLHNKEIRELHKDDPINLVRISLQSYEREFNGFGGFDYEISRHESKSGNPELYTFPITLE
jgi:hypothetical protein